MSSISVLCVLQSIIILFSGLVSYGDNLRGEYVFDDFVAIVKNTDVTDSETDLAAIFTHDFWGYNITDPTSHKSYRPLTILMFHFEHKLFGLNPYYMKAINLVLHMGISCSLLPFYNTIFEFKETRFGPGFLGALLFSIHPIHTEAVSGIVGRAELLTALLYVGSVLVYCSFLRSRSKSILFSFCILFGICLVTTISMLCKETGITILATCAAIDILRNKNFSNKIMFRVLTLGTASLVLIFLRFRISNFESPKFRPMDNPLAANNDFMTRLMTQTYLYCLNFYLLVCPDWLSFDWALGSIPLVESFYDYRLLLVLIFSIFIITALVIGRRREMFLLFSLIVLPFLPASGIIRLGFVIAERVLYIPSIGFSIMIALGIKKLLRNFKDFKILIFISISILIVSFILKTRIRSYEWSNEDILFKSAIRVCPKNAKIYYNIARLATDKNDKETAFWFYKKAIELHPGYEAAYMNLGNLYREINNFDAAEMHLKKSVSLMNEFPAAWMNLGIVQTAMKNYRDALESYGKALKYRKNYPNCLYNIGNMYIDMQNSTMAIKFWNKALQLNPRHSKAWANILALFDNKGKLDEIIRVSEAALNYLPNDSAILFTRANAFGKLGEFKEAESIYKKIISNKPNYALYHANLGVLYHRWNKKDLAKNYYKNALKLDPNLRSAQNNLSKLMNERR